MARQQETSKSFSDPHDDENTLEVVTPFPSSRPTGTRLSETPPVERSESRESTVEKALVKARSSFVAGRFESAIAAAAEVLEAEPLNLDALDLTRLALGAIERQRRPSSDATPGVRRSDVPSPSTPLPSGGMPWAAIGVGAAVTLVLAIAGWRWMKAAPQVRHVVARQESPLAPSLPPGPAIKSSLPSAERPSAASTATSASPRAIEKRTPNDAIVPPVPTAPRASGGRASNEADCDHGDVAKCFDVAMGYQSGNGVSRDAVRAAKLLERICDKGSGQACFELALAYRSGVGVQPDIGRVSALFQKACEGAYASGCNNLGLFYLRGTSVIKDEARAMNLFQRACDAGEAAGCMNLGRGYEFGQGVPKDDARAVAMYQRGCAAGNAAACANFGSAYFRGAGIDKDEARAVTLFRRACDDGSGVGCNSLGVAYSQGRGVPKDEKRAADLYQQSCDKDNAVGCLRLGLIYGRGTVLPRDEARSVALFQRACDGGNVPGCMNLGFAYAIGRGAVKDESRALGLYQRSCDAGTADGCTRAAGMYEQGRGATKDPTRAAALYLRGRELIAKDPDASLLPPVQGVAAPAQPIAPAAAQTSPPAPTKIKDVRPTYPSGALYARVQGDVVIELTIGPDGKVQQTKVVRSIPLLDATAEEAVKQWQFTPTVVNGKAVPVTLTATVRFSLTNPTPETSVATGGR